MRHNEFRDFIANLLSDVCHDVEIKPHLQPLQGETFALKATTTDDDARYQGQRETFALKATTTDDDAKYQGQRTLGIEVQVALKAVAKPTIIMNLLKRTSMNKE